MKKIILIDVIFLSLVAVGIVMAFVTAGGRGVIVETRDIGGQEVELYKITFNGNIGYDNNNAPKGHWQIRFQELSTHVHDGAHFQSNLISDIEYINQPGCPLPLGAPYNIVKFKATGRLDNKYGWDAYVTLTDFEEPAEVMDGVRLILEPRAQTDIPFDTYGDYFTSDHSPPSCSLEGITRIDSGNLRFH